MIFKVLYTYDGSTNIREKEEKKKLSRKVLLFIFVVYIVGGRLHHIQLRKRY